MSAKMNDVYNQTSFENIILIVLAIVVLLVIIGCLYTFVRAIFFFIFWGSKEENKKKGWNSIRFMIIGIVLTLVLLFVFPSVLKVLSVPGHENYTPKKIFQKAGEIVNGAFKLGNFIEESQLDNQYRGNSFYDTTPDASNSAGVSDYDL